MRRLMTVALMGYGALAHAGTTYTVYGAGARHCSEWTIDRAENNAGSVAKEAWITGYISGTNSLWQVGGKKASDVLAGTTLYTVEHRIDRYCLDHPKAKLVDGVDSVLGTIQGAVTRAQINGLIDRATKSP